MLETADIESLWSNCLLGDTSPEALLNLVWLILTFNFGLHGIDEHYKVALGDLEVKETTDGQKCVQFNKRDTKTRTGETGQNTRACQPKRCGAHHKIQIDDQFGSLNRIAVSVPQTTVKLTLLFIWPLITTSTLVLSGIKGRDWG